MSDDEAPTSMRVPADESAAKLRKLADDNPDNSLIRRTADLVEDSVRSIDSAEVAAAQVQQELKRRAEVIEGLKEEAKKLAATLGVEYQEEAKELAATLGVEYPIDGETDAAAHLAAQDRQELKRKAEVIESGSGSEDSESSKKSTSGSESEESESELENENKRRKTAMDAIVKEYSCPLCLELPVEPVTAEDGRVYNRAEITKHIENAKNGDDDDEDDDDDEYKNLRSPITNEKIGPKLVPAVQVQNMIRALVESGTVDDASIDQWKLVDETRSKAMNGDAIAMFNLSDWYCDGSNGLIEDLEMSYSWAKKAADHGDDDAKALVGFMLYKGYGVKRDPTEAALILGMEAAMGSPYAALNLARMYHEVDDDVGCFAKDNGKARYWLNKVLDFGEDEVTSTEWKTAKELQKLLDEEEEENNGS